MRILTIIGARPQFIKAAAVSRVIRLHNDIKEIIVHTGQHFDANMSDVFFEQLDIPRPDHQLDIASLSHGAMTGRMLEGEDGQGPGHLNGSCTSILPRLGYQQMAGKIR